MTGTAVKAATVAMAVILIVVGHLAYTASDPSNDPSAIGSADAIPRHIPVDVQECQVTSKEELKAIPIESSLTYSAEWTWHGPDALIKTLWGLPETDNFHGPVEITGERVGGSERAEFMLYDNEWIRRSNLIIQQGMQGVGYVIFPAPGCWEFEIKAGGDLLGTITRPITYDGPKAQRILPPAESLHGEPPAETPPSLLQAACPYGDGGIQVQRSNNRYSLGIELSSSGNGQRDPVSVGWLGPDDHFSVTWATTDEEPVEVSARNSISNNPAWISVWDRERPNFLHYQPDPTLPVELQQVEGEDRFWYGRILFPEPGCWLITAKGAEVKREMSIWVEPEPGPAG